MKKYSSLLCVAFVFLLTFSFIETAISQTYEAANYFPLLIDNEWWGETSYDYWGETGNSYYDDYVSNFNQTTGIFTYDYTGDNYRQEFYTNSGTGLLMYGFNDGDTINFVDLSDPMVPVPLTLLPATFTTSQYTSETACSVYGSETISAYLNSTTIVSEEPGFTNYYGTAFNGVLRVEVNLIMYADEYHESEIGREQRVYWVKNGIGPIQIEYNSAWDGDVYNANETRYMSGLWFPYDERNERTYKEADTDYYTGEFYLETTYAYVMETNISLIQYEPHMSSVLGDGTIYLFYNNGTDDNPTAARVEFSSGAVGEISIIGEDAEYITKLTYTNSTGTAWFVWDSENPFVEITQRDGSGNWFRGILDYSSKPPAINLNDYVGNPDNWLGLMTSTGPKDMSSLELGNWWVWISRNNLIPEFPALSTTYTFDTQNPARVIQMVNHNDFLDMRYVVDWSNDLCTISIYYDYNNDANDELIARRVYDNDGDYDLKNSGDWEVMSQINYLNGYDVIADFGSGLYKYSNDFWTKLSDLNADSFMLSEENYNGKRDILSDFGDSGFYRYSNKTWSKLSSFNADSFRLSATDTNGAYDIISDFGSGLYKYSGASSKWTLLSALNADSFMLSELYNGSYDIIADFDSGLYKYSGTSSKWTLLSELNADSFSLSTTGTNGIYDIIADFGSGLYKYSGASSKWTLLSALNADTEVAQRLDVQNQMQAYGQTAEGGFVFTSALAGGPSYTIQQPQ